MDTIDQGWAIRRAGDCLAGIEVDCGQTAKPFRGCCPSGYACPHQDNIACCPPGKNCTSALVAAEKPRCANATWDLFDNDGYFCCERKHQAFNRSGTNACVDAGETVRPGDKVLIVVSMGVGV